MQGVNKKLHLVKDVNMTTQSDNCNCRDQYFAPGFFKYKIELKINLNLLFF